MKFYQFISLLWTRFTPLEKRLFAAVRSVLPEAAQPIFDAQISAVTKSQRILNWNEIDYYRIKRGKVTWANIPLFHCTDEIELAEVRFKVAGKQFKAKLFSIHGHIFDFHIQPGGRPIAFSVWDDAPNIKLLDDPMKQPAGYKKPASILFVWKEFLRKHSKDIFEEWVLNDEYSAHPVSLDEGEFLILAERMGDEFVLQRREPPSDQLFYLESHDGTPVRMSTDLEYVFKDKGQ